MDKEEILYRIEQFCLSMNSFLSNDFGLLASESDQECCDYFNVVNSKFVDGQLCCNAHFYLQELSLRDPFKILVRQFVQQQYEQVGTVCSHTTLFLL